MCGIAGLMTIDGSRASKKILDKMQDALVHRGPDGSGQHISDDVGLAHRRLAVIDIATGGQPLGYSKKLTVVANAEIYNFKEVREEYSLYPFVTNSDCEVILPVYQNLGIDFARILRGMYAIALYDSSARHLVLARDPFGIKPLYYSETSLGFAFASEPQALLASGLVGTDINTKKRNEFLQLQFSTGDNTLFKSIKRVLPGETIVISRGRIIDRRRRAALPGGSVENSDEGKALKDLDKALRESVLIHQRSDVPFGLFLSSGIDSAAILTLMADLNSKPILSYTAGFSGSINDETIHASELAAYFGATHIKVEVDKKTFFNRLPEIIQTMDDPAADYAIVPSFLLAERAARDLKVVLCGEGGDELLAGYGRHRSLLRPRIFGGRPARTRGIFDGLDVLRDLSIDWRDGMLAAQNVVSHVQRSQLQIAQAVDCADWLPHDLLTKIDRCLMYHGVEGRTPFLDPSVAKAVFNFPDALKIKNGQGKYILRKWLSQKVPVARAFARKRGFTVPVGEWITEEGGRLGSLVARQPGVREVAVPSAVETLFHHGGKRAGFAAWILLFYALWHQKYLLGRKFSGSVYEVLSDY